MKKALLALLVCALSVAASIGTSFAQCPEDPIDRGECDTLNVICLDCEKQEGESGPWSIRFPLLVTHDQTQPSDSIGGFSIPLAYTHSNPAAYCSVTSYWNETSMLWVIPTFSRSIYRHMFATDYVPTADTLYRNRLAWIDSDFLGRGWDFTVLDLDGVSHYWFTVVPTGTADQRWWESDRTLLATMTMRVQDTMHICMDSTFWPPATSMTFARSDASTYVPRDNMPICFFVGPPLPGDFEIAASPDSQDVTAGNSVDYDVTLTSLNGFSSEVELSATGLPTDATVSFAPDTVIPTGVSVMTISTAATTPAGPSTITITGTELTKVQHSTQVILNVVLPQSVTVTSPNGGEKWCAGSGQNITWTSAAMDSVKIEYSTNGGTGWITVVDQYQATAGSYPWTVPSTPSTNSLVRICDSKDGDPCDQSDAVFTIDDVPAAPSGCVASDDLCDKVQFCWTDNSSNEIKFYIYRDATLLDSVGADVSCYDDVNASPGTTYEYCVSAYNDCGESGQCCENGTRKATPDAPTACAATDDLCDKVQITWTDNSDDETKFYIRRGGALLDSVDAEVAIYDDATASPGVTYEYCVSAVNECGESGQSCDNGTRKAPPVAPSDCAATDDLCDKVQFTWTDNSDNEAGFYIFRDGVEFDTLTADVESYDDLTASPGASYRYCVAAYNECGVSDSCCDNGTRLALPDAPTDCAATDDLCNKVQFTWTDNSDNEAGFYIFRDGVEFDTLAANAVSYDDLTASSGATYRYCVSAFNTCGVSDSCCDDGTRQAAPDAPTACAATDDLCDKVQVTWTDNSDDEEGFYIRREGAKIDSVAADVESYDDPTATPGTTYEYCVSAYKACGESGQSCDNGTRKAPPVAPSDCAATDDLCDKVQFTWTDNSDNETKFYIYRDAALFDSVAADVESYDDVTASGGTTYEYCVRAINECGQSSSCCDNGTRLALPDAPTDCAATDDLCDKVQFTWTDNSDNEAGFYIFRDGVEFDTLAADVESYDDLTASSGATYRYCVSAFNTCGVSDSCCDDGTRQAAPDAPTACAATDDLCDKVQITWTDNSDDEEGFYIRREGAKIDSVAADVESYDDLTATPGTTYEYCVSAYKACGESGQSCDNGSRKAIPDAPTGCVASDDQCDSVHFCWTDNSDNETKFYIYRGAALLDSVDADVNCYDDLSGTPGTEYEYCVTAVNECGESNECCDYGTALAELITLTAPNGGQSWSVGSSHDITWTSQCLDNVKIEFSTNNGSDWTEEIASTPAGTGSYSWTIPDTPSDQCLVRVSDADDGSPNDVSDAVFSIVSGDFSLEVSPDTLRIMREVPDDSFYTVELTSISGFSEVCTLEVSGLPSGATGTFVPATVTPSGSATLTPYADGTVDEGYYDLVVTARELSGAKLIEHEDTVTLWVVLPEWGFDLEASPDSQDVVVGASAQYDITMLPDVGFTAPCTLSVDAGLPAGATADFSDTVIFPNETSTLTIATTGGTPDGRYEIMVRGVANPKEQEIESFVLTVLLVQDYSFSATPDSVHVTQGQAASYDLQFESQFGFNDPCTLVVASGLPTVDSVVFNPPKLIPSGNSLLSVYTSLQTPVGRHVFTVTAQSQPGGKTAQVVEHSLELIMMVEEASDVDDWTDDLSRPQEFALYQNQPNPFNPETMISYFLSAGSRVNLSIYNVLGQRVRTLLDTYQEAGTHSLTWDGRSDDGMQLPSGIYFYRMQAGTFQETKKMALMK
jgi:hypothetical protein